MTNSNEKPAGQYCPLCGGVGMPFGEKDGYLLRQCKGILPEHGVTYGNLHPPILLSWPYKSVAEYESIYTTGTQYHDQMQRERNYATYVSRDHEHGTAAFARSMMLRQYRQTGYLLDIGAAAGAFVAMASAWGYKACGIEPNAAMVEIGLQLGRELRVGTWRNIDVLYDIVCAHDVIEHLTDPNGFLSKMHEILTDDGLFVIDTPEWDGDLSVRHFQKPKEHICCYSRGALELMAERAGFTVIGYHRPLDGKIDKQVVYAIKEKVG